jgi:hypothetical protein
MRSIIVLVIMKQLPFTQRLSGTGRNAHLPLPPLRRSRAGRLLVGFFAAGMGLAAAAVADEEPTLFLKIRNHQFVPAEVEIPAGEKRMLVIENEDATVEEFESHSLHREKIVPPLSKTNLFIGPLKPGRYEFIGEFNEASAKGVVIAR